MQITFMGPVCQNKRTLLLDMWNENFAQKCSFPKNNFGSFKDSNGWEIGILVCLLNDAVQIPLKWRLSYIFIQTWLFNGYNDRKLLVDSDNRKRGLLKSQILNTEL